MATYRVRFAPDIVAKVRNCPGAYFPAVKKSDRRPPIDVASITLPGSPASFSSDDEVPHIFTWKSPGQPKEILTASAKRLLQQNPPVSGPIADSPDRQLRAQKRSFAALDRWRFSLSYQRAPPRNARDWRGLR